MRCGVNAGVIWTRSGGSPKFSIGPLPRSSAAGFTMPTRNKVTSMQNNILSPLRDPRVQTVVDRLQAERRRPADGGPRANPGRSHDPHDYADYGFSIVPEQGDLIYLLCRGMRATRVVEFAT